MSELKPETEKLKLTIKTIRVLLIILTIFELIYFMLIFGNFLYWVNSTGENTHKVIIWILSLLSSGLLISLYQLILMAIILWCNWKKIPNSKKKKIDNTLMILFLGVIGMWLWIPNKKELNQIILE